MKARIGASNWSCNSFDPTNGSFGTIVYPSRWHPKSAFMPSRELTHPSWGKGKLSTQKWFLMGYVSSQEGRCTVLYNCLDDQGWSLGLKARKDPLREIIATSWVVFLREASYKWRWLSLPNSVFLLTSSKSTIGSSPGHIYTCLYINSLCVKQVMSTW